MHDEDDGDRGCRIFGRLHEMGASRHDQVDLESDKVGREFWEASEVTLSLPELDENALALDPAVFLQP
jgi:hypothetical protein